MKHPTDYLGYNSLIHMPIIEYKGKRPRIDAGAFIMSNATLIGDVVIGSDVLVLSNAVLRGDFNQIYLGETTCVQEHAVLNPVWAEPIRIEGNSIIGYGAKVHGGEIERGVFIGMNSVILGGVKIGEDSIVGAGSILTEGMKIPARSLVLGTPAKIVRQINDKDIEWIKWSVSGYMDVLEEYQNGLKEWEIRHTV